MRLLPDEHTALIDAVRTVIPEAAICHVLDHVPEQFEDLYVLLVDGRQIIEFELPRGEKPLPTEVKLWELADYRRHIGQGRARIRLDRVVAEASGSR
jgi:hypothetical protein